MSEHEIVAAVRQTIRDEVKKAGWDELHELRPVLISMAKNYQFMVKFGKGFGAIAIFTSVVVGILVAVKELFTKH